MGLKVHMQNIWPDPTIDTLVGPGMVAVYSSQEAIFRSVLGPEAHIQQGFTNRSTYYCSTLYLQQYNNIGLLEELARAQEDNCDVAVIICGNDPGLMAAREAFTMPVIGITESAMLIACMLGRRFAAVCADQESQRLVEQILCTSGLESRAIRHSPVRVAPFMEDFSRWFTDEAYLRSEVIPQFEAVSRDAITDGAEIIITACGSFSAFTKYGYNRISDSEVPVLEAVLAGAQMAGLAGSLNKHFGVTTSKQSTFRSLPADLVRQRLDAYYSIPDEQPPASDRLDDGITRA